MIKMFSHGGTTDKMGSDTAHLEKTMKLLIAFEKKCCENYVLSSLEASKRDSPTLKSICNLQNNEYFPPLGLHLVPHT